MSRSGVYYAVKAMERAATGSAANGVPGGPGRRAVAGPAHAAAHRKGGIVSLARRVLAATHRGIGGSRAGRGSRRLGGAAQAD